MGSGVEGEAVPLSRVLEEEMSMFHARKRSKSSRLLLLAVTLTALMAAFFASAVQPASAHPSTAGAPEATATTWYWTKAAAAQTIYVNDLDWVDEDTSEDYTDVVDFASCVGRGTNIWNRYGAKMFRNFRCYVETDQGEAYYIAFHVRGKFAYDYDYLYDA
jgi:hypothetical protein